MGASNRLLGLCLGTGFGSLIVLDLYFAPQAIGVEGEAKPLVAPAWPNDPAPTATPAPVSASSSRRVVVPAQARVPTIVARFDTESTEPSDLSGLRAIAAAMIEDHDARIVLEGHSDTHGSEELNHEISLGRAEWVKARLVDRGVSADRIQAVGLGATRPLRLGQQGQAMNRRVEVRWLDPSNPSDYTTPSRPRLPPQSAQPVAPEPAPSVPEGPQPIVVLVDASAWVIYPDAAGYAAAAAAAAAAAVPLVASDASAATGPGTEDVADAGSAPVPSGAASGSRPTGDR